ncbi:MAG: response regulator [Proteobacteria bacterium]|nr:response regulator [Pseudomonadota bacterium]
MRFLIVDDDVSSCQLLNKRLEGYGSGDMTTDGEQALNLFIEAHHRGNPYRIVFLDIVMPGINGHEILKWIREWEMENIVSGEEAKIVMVSQKKDTKNIFTSLESGCDNYMTKPITKRGIGEVMAKLGYQPPASNQEE